MKKTPDIDTLRLDTNAPRMWLVAVFNTTTLSLTIQGAKTLLKKKGYAPDAVFSLSDTPKYPSHIVNDHRAAIEQILFTADIAYNVVKANPLSNTDNSITFQLDIHIMPPQGEAVRFGSAIVVTRKDAYGHDAVTLSTLPDAQSFNYKHLPYGHRPDSRSLDCHSTLLVHS